MVHYKIVFSEGAVKDLKTVPKKDQLKILDKIERLISDPFPKGCVKIKAIAKPYAVYDTETIAFCITLKTKLRLLIYAA